MTTQHRPAAKAVKRENFSSVNKRRDDEPSNSIESDKIKSIENSGTKAQNEIPVKKTHQSKNWQQLTHETDEEEEE